MRFLKIIGKIFLILILLLAFLVLGYFYLFKPFQIRGGNPGPYKNGQLVFGFSKVLRPVKLHDTLVFDTDNTENNGTRNTAYVVGVPGDDVQGKTIYYLSDEKYTGSTVPSGYYVLEFNQSDTLRMIEESRIKYVIWYPFP